MKNAIPLLILGIAQIAICSQVGAFSWLLVWSGLSWMAIGAAYVGMGTVVFGKRSDGTLRPFNVLLLLPYFAMSCLTWLLKTRMTREPASHEIVSGLWLGRRCSGKDLPRAIGLVVDMTAEFWEPRGLREGRTYLCVPTLDMTAPSLSTFGSVVETVANSRDTVYIHCAVGHGRSAMLVAAVLLARGHAQSILEAEQMIKRIRPAVRLNSDQRRRLAEWHASMRLHTAD